MPNFSPKRKAQITIHFAFTKGKIMCPIMKSTFTIAATLLNDVIRTYNNFPSAGPDLRTSEMAMLGSPLVKWGLSRPSLTAMPNPYPGTRSKST